MRTVHKVFAYILFKNRLLVFKHLDHPEAGIQVPAGTVEENELLELAVVREAEEETGLSDFKISKFLGQKNYISEKHNELHIRNFYVLSCNHPNIDRKSWQHGERKSEYHMSDIDRKYGMIRYEFFWIEIEEAIKSLGFGHGDFLHFI